jgi:hypothetical protein
MMNARQPPNQGDQSCELRSAIRRVFVEVWDPIRINDEPNAQDEYDRYIDPVFELLTTGGSDKRIIDHLLWSTGRMGMDGSRVSLEDVVAALREIKLNGKETSDQSS